MVEAARSVLVLTGTLILNQQIILPAQYRRWLIVNATTGAFATTVKLATGTGVIVPQGGFTAPVEVWSDTTEVYNVVAPVNLPIDQAPTPLTIVQRTNAGYVLATYFNQSSAPEVFTAANVFADVGDGFLRKLTVPNFKTQIFASPTLTGVPAAPTAAQGANTAQVATTAFVQSAVLGGVAQAYLGLARALNVAYTNSTALPIQVVAVIRCPASPVARFQVFVNGFAITTDVGNGGVGSIDIPITFIVPSGASYSINAFSGSPTLGSWVELR